MPDVLVVEDDPALRAMMVRALLLRGYGVRSASDGAQALDMLQPWPDVLVLDLSLPQIDGSTLLAEAMSRGFRGKTVIASGAPGAQEVSGFIRPDCFLKKPFDAETLVEVVNSLTDDGNGQAETPGCCPDSGNGGGSEQT